jgi:hypothetical protein
MKKFFKSLMFARFELADTPVLEYSSKLGMTKVAAD